MFPKKVFGQRPLILSFAESPLNVFVVVLVLPGELLSGNLWAAFVEAEGGSTVEVFSSAGSVVPAKVSVLASSRNLKSRLYAPPTAALLHPFPHDRGPALLVLPVDGLLALHNFALYSSPTLKFLAHHSLFRLEALALLVYQLTGLHVLRVLS